MNHVPELAAEFIACPDHIQDSYGGLVRCALANDTRNYSAKPATWPTAWHKFPVRLANELIYYTLASNYGLPVPPAAILNINHEHFWGVEYREERRALSANQVVLSPPAAADIGRALARSPDLLTAYLRSVFLDVMLFNSDRPEWNVLRQGDGGSLTLWYFDHDRSLGWKGDPDDPSRNKIKAPAEEFARIQSYAVLEQRHHWAKTFTGREGREKVFTALVLKPEDLDEIWPRIPAGWLTRPAFEEMRTSLDLWWQHLRGLTYKEIDDRIFI